MQPQTTAHLSTDLLTTDPLATAQSTAAALPDYCFGDFHFVAGKDSLTHLPTGQQDKLEPKVAQLLLLLIRQQGQVLSQEALQQALWPDTIVEQNSLYQLLTKLRRLLRDASRAPQYIKTVPKKGYCFIAPCQQLPATAIVAATASASLGAPAGSASRSTQPTANTTRWWPWRSANWRGSWPQLISVAVAGLSVIGLSIAGLSVVGFHAVASFSRDNQPPAAPTYQVEDISYALGLEFEADAHHSENLLAYVKDIYQLEITDKQGQPRYQQTFSSRIAKPAWHDQQKQLAFWRYTADRCELNIISAQGASAHVAAAQPCQDVQKPVWKSAEELILTLKQQDRYQPYLYRLSTREWVAVPVPASLPNAGPLTFFSAVKGWRGDIYYLMRDAQYRSLLIDLKGNIQMQWPYPVWLIAYDQTTDAMISNDHDKRSALVARWQDGRRSRVFTTAQGLFTSLSIDRRGDIYSAVESWQVNIRDNHNQPVFSTSSMDYLPVSNPLGETAFMSRRSGVCEVYLHSEGQVMQLSDHAGYQYVTLLEWRPDWSMLVSNRDQDIVLYDRQNTLLQFSSQARQRLRNLGWLDNQTLYAFDGHSLLLYNLQGRLLRQQTLEADNLHFDPAAQRWLLQRDLAWYSLAHAQLATGTAELLLRLTPQQAHHMHNIRSRGGHLYWQSDWSKQDYIWSMPLSSQPQVSLRKSGNLIWHFDVNPFQQLTIAKMEALEGDIKKLVAVPADQL